MDTLGSSPEVLPSDPKSMILHQIKQEAALNNARQLVTVQHRPYPCTADLIIKSYLETKQSLLRKMRPVTRLIIVQKGGRLLHHVYGKIHGHVEYRRSHIRYKDNKDSNGYWRWRWN